MIKTLIYAIAFGISVIILGYLALFAILPLAFIIILIEQNRPKTKDTVKHGQARSKTTNNQS
jgi:hypothetical protein